MSASGPHFSAPVRSDLDVEIDRLWRCATLAEDQDIAARYWAKHNELVRWRAAEREKREQGA